MAVKVLALASGVTGLSDHRILNGSMLTPGGLLHPRSGVLRTPGGGDLTTVSAMVARVAAVKVVIQNGVSSALGPYLLVSDGNVDITFDPGEASVARTDRIIARVYDDVNDGSGSTTGAIEYLKGQASGTATALPTNSVLLYEMSIPAGASAGSGGVNFANAQDRRIFTAAHGGIFPVGSNTDMSAVVSPYEGMTIYRTDIDVLYVYDGSTWRPRGQASVAAFANLSTINNPHNGMLAVTRDTGYIYVYDGSTWQLRAGNTNLLYDQRTADTAAITSTTLVSALQITLPRAGTYVYDLFGPFTNFTAVGRVAFGLGGTSTPTAWRWASEVQTYNATNAIQGFAGEGTTFPGATAGTVLVNSDLNNTGGYASLRIFGTITVSAAGTLQFRFATNGVGNQIIIRRNTMVTAQFVG
jgi:hypothetical protein